MTAGASGWDAINPDELGPPKGWTNGMLAPAGGRILFVAGQDAATAEGVVVLWVISRHAAFPYCLYGQG